MARKLILIAVALSAITCAHAPPQKENTLAVSRPPQRSIYPVADTIAVDVDAEGVTPRENAPPKPGKTTPEGKPSETTPEAAGPDKVPPFNPP